MESIVDRRDSPRFRIKCPIKISSNNTLGETVDISDSGLQFVTSELLDNQFKLIEVNFPGKDSVILEFKPLWHKDSLERGEYRYGGEFSNINDENYNKFKRLFAAYLKQVQRIPRFADNDYDLKSVEFRRKWLEEQTGCSLKHASGIMQDTRSFRGNIEHLIGVCQIPLGVAGPIRVKGEYAKGDFYIPLATTEGALVKTYHRGMRVVSEAGGVNVRILKEGVHISPAFFVENIIDGMNFINWLKENFSKIKAAAEKTTQHGKLLEITPFLTGRRVLTKFIYNTQDAQGLNMINKATQAACEFIATITEKKYCLRSDFSTIKKVSSINFHNGQGKSVFADVIIPKRLLKLLEINAEDICECYQSWTYAKDLSGEIGRNVQVANLLAAVFSACGQDIADVSMSHVGIYICEATVEKDLYIGLYLPNLMVGTIGGGTKLASQKECLNLMGCYGTGKVKKFVEIICAAALAGEIATNAAILNNTYVWSHELYARKNIKIGEE